MEKILALAVTVILVFFVISILPSTDYTATMMNEDYQKTERERIAQQEETERVRLSEEGKTERRQITLDFLQTGIIIVGALGVVSIVGYGFIYQMNKNNELVVKLLESNKKQLPENTLPFYIYKQMKASQDYSIVPRDKNNIVVRNLDTNEIRQFYIEEGVE